MRKGALVYRWINGIHEAAGAIFHIVHSSQFLEFTPLPDDWYCIGVKKDAAKFLPDVNGRNVLDVSP